MHEWHTEQSTDIMSIIEEFENFEYRDNYKNNKVSKVVVTDKMFPGYEEALNYVTDTSYHGNSAYVASYCSGKVTKAFQNAFRSFLEKYKECDDFERNLNIGYGRKSSKVTCPNCESSINLGYGGRLKSCPVCGSRKIISDSNWKTLETKIGMVHKASKTLKEEASKCGVMFIGGFEWHC